LELLTDFARFGAGRKRLDLLAFIISIISCGCLLSRNRRRGGAFLISAYRLAPNQSPATSLKVRTRSVHTTAPYSSGYGYAATAPLYDYAAPAYGYVAPAPAYTAPQVYTAPVYAAPQVYTAPVYAAPQVYTAPPATNGYSTTTAVVAQPIYDYAPGYGYGYTPGYWNRGYWGRYGYGWR
jgi:hypothetical protein